MSRNLAAVLLAACATTTTSPDKPGSRGMRASEHLEAANREDQLAREAYQSPNLGQDPTGASTQVPWARVWSPQKDHDRLAQIHRTMAGQLHAEYDEACGSRPAAEVAVSPFRRYGIGGNPIQGGAVLFLSPDAGPPDRLLRDMRCHRAWMMLSPSDMQACPLDLSGIEVSVKGDANEIAVTITVRNKNLVDELQRRVTIDLEAASQHPR